MNRAEALLKLIIKDFGLGVLWITLGMSSSKTAVTVALVIMGTGQFALSVLGVLKRRRARHTIPEQRKTADSDAPPPHVGGGITSSTVPALPQHEHAVAVA